MNSVLTKGTVLGGLTLGEPLGQGGFGITYLARDNKSGTKFALKEYFPSDYATRLPNGSVSSQSDTKKLFDYGRTSFIDEANTLKTLPRQKGLVRVRGAFERNGTAYCVMEYIEGDPLDKMIPRLIQQYGGVPQNIIEQFLDPVSWALAAIHAKKLIHRDVKPGNIMIRRNGEPVLIDFGAARVYGRRSNAAVMFTRKYAPIEQFPPDDSGQIRSLREGPWSDLFSLSVMLYEMVSRRVPPDAQTRMNTLKQTGKDPYVPIEVCLEEKGGSRTPYSPQLLHLIDYGCALMPRDRPRNAMSYRALLIDDDKLPERDENARRSASIADNANFRTNGRLSDRTRGRIVMAFIIMAIAVVAGSYGLWGAF